MDLDGFDDDLWFDLGYHLGRKRGRQERDGEPPRDWRPAIIVFVILFAFVAWYLAAIAVPSR